MAFIQNKKGLSVAELASILSIEVQLDGRDRVVNEICSYETPNEGGLTFVDQRSLSKLLLLDYSSLSAVVLKEELVGDLPDDFPPVLIVPNPLEAVVKLIPHLYSKKELVPTQISDLASVASSAMVSETASVAPFCVIGEDVSIGDGAVLYPHVVIYDGAKVGNGAVLHAGVVIRENCEVGENVVIQPGAVVGADGFGYIPDPSGQLVHVPQIGNVTLGNGVDVGANSCIDRGTFGQTEISDGAKIDNLVQIGHNVKIGQSSILCGQSGVAGSSKLGNGVVLGGGSGVADHVEIVDRARVAGHSGVTGSIKEQGDYAGFPAVPAKEWRRQAVALRKLGKK